MTYKFYGWNNSDVKAINNDYPNIENPIALYEALDNIWCIETCAPRLRKDYLTSHKTLGQCSITSFLVQDIFGGEVYGVPLDDGSFHCFNIIDNKLFDLTSEQFDYDLAYTTDFPQNRETHFSSEEKYERYQFLKNRLYEATHSTDFYQLAQKRYSVRKFTDEKIEKDKINMIIKAGRIAPTAHNNQPQKILVLQSEEALKKWQKCTVCHYNEQLVLLTCYDRNISWKRDYDKKDSGDVDCAIVTTHMMLEAANLNIGSTWIMYFIPEAIKEEFQLPENYEPVSALVLGYPDLTAVPSASHNSKREEAETIFYDNF